MGNFLTSVIAGIGTYVWLLIFGAPHPVPLAMKVALSGLIPVIGGAGVPLVALTVSLLIAAALGSYVAYKLAEAAVRLLLQEVVFRRLDTS